MRGSDVAGTRDASRDCTFVACPERSGKQVATGGLINAGIAKVTDPKQFG